MSRPPAPRDAPFKVLYHAYFAFVWHRVRCAGVPERHVADVVQEIFEVLDREIVAGSVDTSEPLWGWLCVTTIRRARDWMELGRNREIPSEATVFERADEAPNPEEHTETVEVRENLQAVLDALPLAQRLVLLMHVLDAMPMSEIAVALKIPVDTGYSRLKAAKKTAARLWDERRQQGLGAVMPLALWNLDALLETQRAIPLPPPGVEQTVWRSLTAALRNKAGAIAGAVGGGAAVKVGTLLTAKQIAVGIVVSAMTGAGAYALARRALDPPVAPPALSAPIALTAPRAPGPASALAPPEDAATAREAVAQSAVTATASAATAVAAGAGTSVRNTEAEERIALDLAQVLIQRGELEGARAQLAKVHSPRFVSDREELRRQLRLRQDGGR